MALDTRFPAGMTAFVYKDESRSLGTSAKLVKLPKK